MPDTNLNVRIIHKHDVESNWLSVADFIPMKGEPIVYDIDESHTAERLKIGDGVHTVNELPFVSQNLFTNDILHSINNMLLSNILDTYILFIDYDTELAFDTTEVVFGASTTSVLGRAVLGQLILA